MRWQWFLTILLGLGWLLVACANAEWSRDQLKAKSGHNSSPVVLLGALFAVGALAACPWEHPHKWVLLVPALVLDVGSGPLVVLSVVALILEGISVHSRRVAGGYLKYHRETRSARIVDYEAWPGLSHLVCARRRNGLGEGHRGVGFNHSCSNLLAAPVGMVLAVEEILIARKKGLTNLETVTRAPLEGCPPSVN